MFRVVTLSTTLASVRPLRLASDVSVSYARVNEHVRVLVFQPAAAASSSTLLPLFINIHGGGWCLGSPEEKMFWGYCKFLASRGMVVVSPAYRLAPEHPFPVPLSDCYETLRWVVSRPVQLRQADFGRVVLGGDSAGGNLALVLATLLRDGLDAGLAPDVAMRREALQVRHLALVYPSMLLPFQTRSMSEQRDQLVLPQWVGRWFLRSYVPGPEQERQRLLQTDRRLCPLHAGLHGLPLAAVYAASHDPLLDDSRVLCKELARQGSPQRLRVYANVTHGFATFFNRQAFELYDDICADLGSLLAPGSASCAPAPQHDMSRAPRVPILLKKDL